MFDPNLPRKLWKIGYPGKNNEDNFRNDDKKRCRSTIMLLLLLMIPPLRGRSARWQKLIVNRETIILLISETGDTDGTPEGHWYLVSYCSKDHFHLGRFSTPTKLGYDSDSEYLQAYHISCHARLGWSLSLRLIQHTVQIGSAPGFKALITPINCSAQ